MINSSSLMYPEGTEGNNHRTSRAIVKPDSIVLSGGHHVLLSQPTSTQSAKVYTLIKLCNNLLKNLLKSTHLK